MSNAKTVARSRHPKTPAWRLAPEAQASRDEARSRHVIEVLKNLRIIFKSAQKHSRWVENQCGVSDPQLWVLAELCSKPGLRVMDLAGIMSLHQSTVSNLLDKIEKKALVRRERCTGDQRVVRLYLTDEGREVLDRAPKPAMSLLPDALFKLPDDVVDTLCAATRELVIALGVNKDEEAALEPINRF